MTFCSTYGSTHFTLVFSGSTLGDHLASFRSVPRRATQVEERHNLWATTPILDGSYPALVWDHEFLVYQEDNYPLNFAETYFNLAAHFTSAPQSLIVKLKTDTAIAFGDCYMREFTQSDPEQLLLYAAGILPIKFVGTQIPSVS